MIDSYPHRLAGHCSSGAFRDLLEHRGLGYDGQPLSEPMVFGLAAGLDTLFTPLPPGRGRASYYLGGRSVRFEENLQESLGLRCRRVAVADPDEGWQRVRSRLDAGEPTLVFADCADLDYLNVRTHMSMHSIVLVGYDDEQRVAFVADNDRADIQRCSYESLRRARNSFHFPAPTNHTYLEIGFPDRLPSLAVASRVAIERVVRQMREPAEFVVEVFGRDFSGLPALRRFVAFSAGQPDEAASHLLLYVEKAGTGGGFFRRLWADFLREVGTRLDDPTLTPAADAYAELAARWTTLCAETPARIPAAVAETASDEERAVGLLERWLSSAR